MGGMRLPAPARARPDVAPLEAAAALDPAATARDTGATIRLFATIAVPVLALAMWAVSLRGVDLSRMNDLGLISVLPIPALLAMAALAANFWLLIRRPDVSMLALTLQLVPLMLIIYGTPPILEDAPRFTVAWRHAGVTDHIMRTGEIDPRIDAYFNWPGFFALGALLASAGGLSSPVPLMEWTPFVSNLLYVLPLLLLFRAASGDMRVAFAGAWLFVATNWIGQDYFSPQGFVYLLYLTLLAVVIAWLWRERPSLAWLTLPRVGASPPGRAVSALRRFLTEPGEVAAGEREGIAAHTRPALLVIVLILFVVIVGSHQLTPFAVLGGMTALVIMDRVVPRGLPVLMAAVIGGWLIYMAVTWLTGHFGALTEDLGNVGGVIGENVSGRLQGSFEHAIVLRLRILVTLAVWGLAFLGALLRLRGGYRDIAMGALAVVPFALLGAQGYGGEILLRVYLFALPFVCFFIAAGVAVRRGVSSWLRTGVMTALSVVLVGALVITRYGNERMDWMAPEDVATVEQLYRIAPQQSRVVAVTNNLPWKAEGYATYDWAIVAGPDVAAALDVDEIELVMRERPKSATRNTRRPEADEVGAYLIVTRSQRAFAELFAGIPPARWAQFEAGLRRSERFREVYRNGSSAIYVLADQPGVAEGSSLGD